MTLNGTYDNEESAHVLTRIPGRSEDAADHPDGEPQHRFSAIPAPFDAEFQGDYKKGWKDDLNLARSKKYPAEYSRSFPNYRMDTAIEIGFNTSDGKTIDQYEVQMTEPGVSESPGSVAPITLEGESDEPDNIYRNKYDGFDSEFDGQYHRADIKGPHTDKKTFTAESSDDEVIEGVRGSIILGGSDPYLRKRKEQIFSFPLQNFDDLALYALKYILHVATFYSWIDFAFMADGTKRVTIWDASVYPAHALYVGSDWKDQNKFREGLEWVEKGWKHGAFLQFGKDANTADATPFDQGGNFLYKIEALESFRDGFGNHPVMEFVDPGTTLFGDESEFQDPMYPSFS